MPATSTLVGASLGLGVQFYSNAVRKLPLLRNPWEHVIATGLGGMVGSYVVAWEERVTKEVADLEAKRAKRFAGATMRD